MKNRLSLHVYLLVSCFRQIPVNIIGSIPIYQSGVYIRDTKEVVIHSFYFERNVKNFSAHSADPVSEIQFPDIVCFGKYFIIGFKLLSQMVWNILWYLVSFVNNFGVSLVSQGHKLTVKSCNLFNFLSLRFLGNLESSIYVNRTISKCVVYQVSHSVLGIKCLNQYSKFQISVINSVNLKFIIFNIM